MHAGGEPLVESVGGLLVVGPVRELVFAQAYQVGGIAQVFGAGVSFGEQVCGVRCCSTVGKVLVRLQALHIHVFKLACHVEGLDGNFVHPLFAFGTGPCKLAVAVSFQTFEIAQQRVQHGPHFVDGLSGHEVNLDGQGPVSVLQFDVGAPNLHRQLKPLAFAGHIVQVEVGLACAGCLQSHGLTLVPVALGGLLVQVVGGREELQRVSFGAAHLDQEAGGAAGHFERILPALRQHARNQAFVPDGGTYDFAGIGVVGICHVGQLGSAPVLNFRHAVNVECSLDRGLGVVACRTGVGTLEGEVFQELTFSHPGERIALGVEGIDGERNVAGGEFVPHRTQCRLRRRCLETQSASLLGREGEQVRCGTVNRLKIERRSVHELFGKSVPRHIGTERLKILLGGLPVEGLIS